MNISDVNPFFEKLNCAGLIKNSQMRYLIDDRGIAKSYYTLLINSIPEAKQASECEYLYLLAYMCWGAGAFFTAQQWSLNKPITEFTNDEIDEMFVTLTKNDAVALGYNSLGILVGSYNYNVITNGIKQAFLALYDSKELSTSKSKKADIMQLFFNLGVTFVYERMEK